MLIKPVLECSCHYVAGGIHMIVSCIGSRCETSLGTKLLFIGRKSEGSKRESAQSELRCT